MPYYKENTKHDVKFMNDEMFTQIYQDALYNIEKVIISVYQKDNKFIDLEAINVMDYCIREQNKKMQGATYTLSKLSGSQESMYILVSKLCAYMMGENVSVCALFKEAIEDMQVVNIMTSEDIIACLRRIQRSMRMWNKKLGRRGYYEFVQDFVSTDKDLFFFD